MRRPITSLWVQTHPNVLIPKSLGKKKTSCGRKFTKPSGIFVLRVHVLCGCGDLRRSGLINVFFGKKSLNWLLIWPHLLLSASLSLCN